MSPLINQGHESGGFSTAVFTGLHLRASSIMFRDYVAKGIAPLPPRLAIKFSIQVQQMYSKSVSRLKNFYKN